jgi:hypothetical protein
MAVGHARACGDGGMARSGVTSEPSTRAAPRPARLPIDRSRYRSAAARRERADSSGGRPGDAVPREAPLAAGTRKSTAFHIRHGHSFRSSGPMKRPSRNAIARCPEREGDATRNYASIDVCASSVWRLRLEEPIGGDVWGKRMAETMRKPPVGTRRMAEARRARAVYAHARDSGDG